MSNSFKEKFLLVLEADVSEDIADTLTATLDGHPDEAAGIAATDEAMQGQYGAGGSPLDYLTNPEADKEIQQAIDQRNEQIASVLSDWVNRMEEFTDFINGTGESSIQTILSNAQPGTLLAKIQGNTSRKLANAATEVASISETLKSFIGQKAITPN